MSKSKINPLITASVMSAVCLAGVSQTDVVQAANTVSVGASLTEEVNQNGSFIPAPNALGQRRYIITLEEAALANYNGVGQFAPIPRGEGNRLLSKSPAAVAYVEHLKQVQTNFLSSVSGTLGRDVDSIFTYQYALNGVVIEMTAAEAAEIRSIGGIKNVELDREYSMSTDQGPQLIGADNVWTGTAPASGMAFGEGVVIGVLDSGANFDHPSFADVGDDAYDHTNPLGSGFYLGVCDPTNMDQFDPAYTCNDKIIGGYDFVFDITPPGGTDIPGPEDENGHGTHTASTAGGNLVTDAEFSGITGIGISGVARHANLVIFDVCYNPAPGAGGGCFGSAAAESIDQMLADGIVNAINYSISGGNSPWGEAASLAFLSATDSGIFVATSGGNAGPGPGTAGHVEPWTTSSAASTHIRRFSNALTVTGPVPPAPSLVDALAIQGTGPAMAVDMVGTINYSGIVEPANIEGCNAYTDPNAFLGVIALISRGGCSFADKLTNATAAGATGVVVHNNRPGDPIVMGGLETSTLPSVMVSEDIGTELAAYITANPTATVSVAAATSISLAGQADSLAGFSSRGPSPFEVNKPDIAAPGVSILAGFADSDPSTGTPAEYGAISGTSMASPHTAGSAALLKELHPTWTAPEIRSALMMTAVTAGMTKEDQQTVADPFDRGSGRVQVDAASSVGLVLNETAFRYLQADPANGGDPKTLNIASYKNDSCVGTCTFQRKFRSVAAGPVEYNASLSGMTGTVNPANFTANPGQVVTIDVEIDGAALPAGAVSFGELLVVPAPDSVEFTSAPAAAIADGAYDGTNATMACDIISVSGLSGSEVAVEVDAGLTHTWLGDLTVKLTNPDALVLGLQSLSGEVEVADDGTGSSGESSNLIGSSPITYADGAAVSAEDMGAALAGSDDVVCQDDGVCEFSPAPGSIASPPATLADVFTTNDGDWTICAGDSVSFDAGTLDTWGLRFVTPSALSDLHLPLVVTGFPEQPDIDVTPTTLSATLDADMTTDLNLNIANSPVAGADLNWTIGTGNFSVTFAEQVDGTGAITNGIVSGFFLQDDGGNGAGAYSADDFVLTGDSSISTMFFEGFANGASLDTSATAIQLHVYADLAGVPAGHPEDGMNAELFALDIPVADPSLDLTDNNILIDVTAANGGSPLDLPAGTYWVTVFPTQDIPSNAGTRWAWFAAGPDVAGATAQLVSPISFNVADWTGIPGLTAEPNFEQLRYNIAGTSQCGATWMTTSSSGGAVAPGDDTDVTVTLDSTGLAPGVYEAGLCIESDDPDEAQVVVTVTLTVQGLPDLIFADGFDTPAP